MVVTATTVRNGPRQNRRTGHKTHNLFAYAHGLKVANTTKRLEWGLRTTACLYDLACCRWKNGARSGAPAQAHVANGSPIFRRWTRERTSSFVAEGEPSGAWCSKRLVPRLRPPLLRHDEGRRVRRRPTRCAEFTRAHSAPGTVQVHRGPNTVAGTRVESTSKGTTMTCAQRAASGPPTPSRGGQRVFIDPRDLGRLMARRGKYRRGSTGWARRDGSRFYEV